jgi:hypothetical protein
MRILVDENDLPWEEAWEASCAIFGYTNHTLLPEALERWSLPLLDYVLPRHLQIIYEINRRFLDEVSARFPGDQERLRRMSLIEEDSRKQVRMAHLAIVGSHSINGVSALHTELIQSSLVPDFAQLWPERFNNKTNGVTPRRWLLGVNPQLSEFISGVIGRGWVSQLSAGSSGAPVPSVTRGEPGPGLRVARLLVPHIVRRRGLYGQFLRWRSCLALGCLPRRLGGRPCDVLAGSRGNAARPEPAAVEYQAGYLGYCRPDGQARDRTIADAEAGLSSNRNDRNRFSVPVQGRLPIARPQRDSIFTRPRAGVLAAQKVRFAPDSPLEQTGGKLQVPLAR